VKVQPLLEQIKDYYRRGSGRLALVKSAEGDNS